MQNMPDFRFLFPVDPVVLKKSDVKLSMEWQTIKDYLGMSFYTFIKTGTHSHTHLLAHTHTHTHTEQYAHKPSCVTYVIPQK